MKTEGPTRLTASPALDQNALRAALDRFYARTAHGIRPGLETVQCLLDLLCHPEQAFPYVHVAGTNGKGSVCALLASILQAGGNRVGLYTSPHLVAFNERIRMDGVPVSDEKLAEWVQLIEPLAEYVGTLPDQRPPTFFECATVMALHGFRAEKMEWCVLETGLGGRLDATNIGTPAISIITSIGMDHTEYLGDTLAKIAAEKAGIIKPGIPVVLGEQQEEARAVVEQTARSVGAPIVQAREIVRIERVAQDWSGQKIRLETAQGTGGTCHLPLTGKHQLENAALAIAAVETLQSSGHLALADDAIRRGLAACEWPGRLQVLSRDPLVVLDVAHNPSGAQALRLALRELAPKRPVGFVVGFLKDKDAVGCVAEWSSCAHRFWAVPVQGSRGRSAEDVATLLRPTGKPVAAGSLDEALHAAQKWAHAQNGIVCIAGSLYLAGEVMALWNPQ